MDEIDLEDIVNYWGKKYPNIAITLYPKGADGMYYGKMITNKDCFNLSSSTIGELISQGESFLRGVI